MAANVAVTAWSELIGTLHEPVPEQAPVQPVKVEPLAGVAVSVTPVAAGYVALHVPGQLMPLPVTVPEPVPARLTVSAWALP